MIFITQLIYIHEGQESVFQEFENIAIPAISKYKGRLLLRIRPTKASFIEHCIDQPYEIHVVEFESDQDLEKYKEDENRNTFLHLKYKSVKPVLIIKGTKI